MLKPGPQSDLPQPAAKGSRRSQTAQTLPRLHENILGQIVGKLGITGPAPQQAPNRCLPAEYEFTVCIVVPGSRQRDEGRLLR